MTQNNEIKQIRTYTNQCEIQKRKIYDTEERNTSNGTH